MNLLELQNDLARRMLTEVDVLKLERIRLIMLGEEELEIGGVTDDDEDFADESPEHIQRLLEISSRMKSGIGVRTEEEVREKLKRWEA